jgi:hypothetical protein
MGTLLFRRSPHNVLLWQYFLIIQVGRSILQCRVGCGTLFALPYPILSTLSDAFNKTLVDAHKDDYPIVTEQGIEGARGRFAVQTGIHPRLE